MANNGIESLGGSRTSTDAGPAGESLDTALKRMQKKYGKASEPASSPTTGTFGNADSSKAKKAKNYTGSD